MKEKTQGSMIILAIIAVLILSLMVIAGLTVSSTEVNTTQNYYLGKVSYYTAVEGVERVAEDIRLNPDPSAIIYNLGDMQTTEKGLVRDFITGTTEDLQSGTAQPIQSFSGFAPPPPPGISLGTSSGVSSVIWDVKVTSQVSFGAKRAFSEIEAGIFSTVVTAY